MRGALCGGGLCGGGCAGGGGRWPRGGGQWPIWLERCLGMATGHSRPGSNPASVKTFRFGTLAIPFASVFRMRH